MQGRDWWRPYTKWACDMNESRKVKEYERYYATCDLELEVIVHSFNMWRHSLVGKIFDLRIDNSGLKYVFGQLTMNSTQIIWLKTLS